MSTNHTPNYSLSQWQASDQVLRTDFNEDNAKIDAALAGKLGHLNTIFTLRPSPGGHFGGGYGTDTLRMNQYDMAAIAVEFPQEIVDASKKISVIFFKKENCSLTFPMQSFVLLFFPHYNLSTPFRCLLLCDTPRYLVFDEPYEELVNFRLEAEEPYMYGLPDPTIRFLGWK